jgi:GTPase SAR1 family protein
LGDSAVGKSCLVVRFVRDEFFEFQEPTIGGKVEFAHWSDKSVSIAFLLSCFSHTNGDVG